MLCTQPLPAWKDQAGTVRLGSREKPGDRHPLYIGCGHCIGCRSNKARAWALRCTLELQRHHAATWTTLTYADAPPTLHKPHLSGFLKRLRQTVARSKTARPIRFFACGEYGDTYGRPHYHAILYGLPATERSLVEDTWGLGITDSHEVTPAMICYTAGYTAKKLQAFRPGHENEIRLDPELELGRERVNPHTGEVYYTKEQPFLQMSRRPGIGAHAKAWPHSWRSHAVLNGRPIPVPRYLHAAWKEIATAEQIEQLNEEKLNRNKITDTYTLNAQEAIYNRQQQLKAEKRSRF